MIIVSFDVGDERQKDFESILERLEFKKTLGIQGNTEYLPESTMARTGYINLDQLKREIDLLASQSKIEIKRLVLFGGEPQGIVTLGTKLKTKE